MTVLANQAACYQKLGNTEKCMQLIAQCEAMPARQRNKDVAYYHRTVYFTKAFYYFSQEQWENSLSFFQKCFTVKLKNDQIYLAARYTVYLSLLLGQSPDNDMIKYSRMSHNPIFDIYEQEGVLLHTFRFIE